MAQDSTSPVPPVPNLTPMCKGDPKDEPKDKAKYLINVNWTRWFTQIKAKLDLINVALASLANLSTVGFAALTSSGVFIGRTITGSAGDIDVANGNGDAGNPVISNANSGVIPGTYGDSTHVPQITITSKGKITSAVNVTISGGGGSGLNGYITSTGDIYATTGFANLYVSS